MLSIPDSYKPGVTYIESLNVPEMREWLHTELCEIRGSMLSGQADDFPVQAIVNHAKHVSKICLGNLHFAIYGLIVKWSPADGGNGPYGQYLFSLAAELQVPMVKVELQYWVLSESFRYIKIQPDMLRAISTLSDRADEIFWKWVGKTYPVYGETMVSQTLGRISKL